MRSGEQVGLHDKGDQASNVALAEGRQPTYTFPFPFFFHQLQEPLLGIVVPGPIQIHPSPNPPRREKAEGKEGLGEPPLT